MPDVKKRLVAAGSAMRPPDDPFDRLLKRRDRRRRNERLVAGGVAVVVALAAVGGGLFALSKIGGGELGRVGDEPEADPSLVLNPGQYFYLKVTSVGPQIGTQQSDGSMVFESCKVVGESWWAADQSGRVRTQADSPCSEHLKDREYAAGDFPSGDELSGLSTDPTELRTQLRERSSASGASPQPNVTPGGGLPLETGQLWRAIQAMLKFPQAVPELRIAIYHVAAGLDGVETIRNVKDPVGRNAIELKLTTEGSRIELFFDEDTLQLMARTEAPVKGDYPASYDILESGIVDSTNSPPSDDQWLFPQPVTGMPKAE